MEDISRCFSVDSAAECRRLVEEAALTAKGVRVGDWEQENWAKRALRHWDNVSPALAEVSKLTCFHLTYTPLGD